MSCILLWTVNPPPHWLRSAHDTVFFLSSSLIWLITLRQEAQDLEQAYLPCPPLKLCNFARNGTWTSTFINQHCLPPRKMQIRSSRALFICTKEAIYWLLHSEHMDKTPKVTKYFYLQFSWTFKWYLLRQQFFQSSLFRANYHQRTRLIL